MPTPAPFDSAGMFLGYPVNSPAQEIFKQTPEVGRADGLLANFRVVWPYFHVNSVDKSNRKAIINYLRESKTKIRENPRWSSTSGCNNMSSRRAG